MSASFIWVASDPLRLMSQSLILRASGSGIRRLPAARDPAASASLDAAGPVPLMMCWMVPVPPSETVTMSCHWTPDVVGEVSAFALTSLGFTLK